MRFTLITEGVSENRIIKQIISKYFKDEEIFFRDAQPQIVNDKQETVGGWNEVLKYCERTADLKEIFINSDFLVIQIDTDMCETAPFNVRHLDADNKLKTLESLYEDVVEKLKSLIIEEILNVNDNNIIFAICVHSIECWLMPLQFLNHHITDTRNCLPTLNKELRRKNLKPIAISAKNSPKSIIAYDAILRAWRKRDDIIESSKSNIGFQKFIDSLQECVKE